MSLIRDLQNSAQPGVVTATDWRTLDLASIAGKKVVCALAEPYAQFHDPAFRDLPALVSLWVVNGEEAARQAKALGLRFVSENSGELQPALASAPVAKAAPSRSGPRASVEPGAIRKGLQALGLSRPRHEGLTVSIFREFVKPPYGGANQFMLALKAAMESRGVRVLVNEVSPDIQGYYFDSLWFDEKLLRKLEKIENPVVIHRIDGPIHLYRGKDKEIDDQIFAVNSHLATSSVIQSDFTLEKVFETGYRPVRPVVVRNACDPAIFHPPAIPPKPLGRNLRIIATSWSDNPNKGGPVYKWLEDHLDYGRYEFTFVGRCSENLTKARVIAPVTSEKLADLLHEHDVYLTASQNDPCSNALIEALSSGLPAIALRSGGHPELVGAGGLCFQSAEEIPSLLDQLARDYEAIRARVNPPRMADVVERYLDLVRMP
ncbi:MAG: glycosyltransferase [Bdellovibrionota bacterium]